MFANIRAVLVELAIEHIDYIRCVLDILIAPDSQQPKDEFPRRFR